MIYLVISFLAICQTTSLFLWHIIYQYISKKPLISVTLVDWIYRDTIVYIYSFCSLYSIAIIHTLIGGNEKFSLEFEYTIIYTFLINFFCNNIYVCLTIAAGLRLISLIKSSEAAGLQLLGPDNEAVPIVRGISIFISFIFPCYVIFVLGAYPGLFGLFHGDESRSNLVDIQNNMYVSLYLLLPCLTSATNLSVLICSSWIKKKMKDAFSVFIIYKVKTQSANPKKFLFTFSQATFVPVLTITVFLQSFCDRKQRLFFLSPLHIFLCSVLLPVFIILKNKKMKTKLGNQLVQSFKRIIITCLTFLKKRFYVKIKPINYSNTGKKF